MRIYQPDRDLLDRFIAAKAGSFAGTVLDIGGGNGKRYRSHFVRVGKYITLDADAKTQPEIVADAESLPLEDGSMDGVICSEVLMYVRDIPKAVAEMARVLKPGSPLVLTTSFMATPAVHEHYRSQPGYAGLKELFAPHFSCVSVEPRGGYHVTMRQHRCRYAILRHGLYGRRVAGNAYSLYNKALTIFAERRDEHDGSVASRSFTMGYNVYCTK